MSSDLGRPRPIAMRRRPGALALAAVLMLGLLMASHTASAGETYFVDNGCPTCSPIGPGTETEPYCTIAAAVANRKGPGITIVVKPGVYREQITISASGDAEAPYVIRAAGPGVVVDGADDFTGETRWVLPGAAELGGDGSPQVLEYAWLARDVTWDAQQVFVDGRRLTRSTDDPARLAPNAFTWVPGEGLYVNIGTENPGRKEILVGRRASAFRLGEKSWVVIEGFEVTRADNTGINVFPGCADLVIARNQISYSESYGIKVAGSQRVRVEENRVTDGLFHGIGLTAGSTGCVLHGNEATRNAHPTTRMAKGIYIAAAPNNILEGNRTWDNQDSGIQINRGSHFCLLFNNQSWGNGDHGFDHLDAIGTIHVNDVAYGNQMDGFSIEGESPGAQVFNCIAFDNGLTTGRFNLWVNIASSVDFRSDYNIYWNSNGQEPFKFRTTKYLWLADYQAASGQDLNSIQANPQLQSPRSGNFIPLAGSPAIDAGNSGVQHWPACDDAGHARFDDPATPNLGVGPVTYADIGAVEYVQPVEEGVIELPSPRAVSEDRTQGTGSASPVAGARPMAFSGASPNPSRGAVEFALDVPEDVTVEWAVYDLQGRTIWSEHRAVAAGRAQLRWGGTSASGEPVSNGVYLVRARVGTVQVTRRLIRL